jgi:hypothetical protein
MLIMMDGLLWLNNKEHVKKKLILKIKISKINKIIIFKVNFLFKDNKDLDKLKMISSKHRIDEPP